MIAAAFGVLAAGNMRNAADARRLERRSQRDLIAVALARATRRTLGR